MKVIPIKNFFSRDSVALKWFGGRGSDDKNERKAKKNIENQ